MNRALLNGNYVHWRELVHVHSVVQMARLIKNILVILGFSSTVFFGMYSSLIASIQDCKPGVQIPEKCLRISVALAPQTYSAIKWVHQLYAVCGRDQRAGKGSCPP